MGLLKWLKPQAAPPAVPAGIRAYAIGDVHGRRDLLAELLARIEEDSASRGDADVRLILLGDLVDRGPDSRGVVDLAIELCRDDRCRLLKGNHEDLFIAAARGDRDAARVFCAVGGLDTLRSYGIPDEEAEAGSFADLVALMAERIPPSHIDFLDAAPDYLQLGDYVFVHAGIRPGVPLEKQIPEEMRWIRAEFTRSERDHGRVIVHGHTITEEVDIRANRIGIDTGAYASGRLSALGLEGDRRWTLATSAA